jgi:hypothetical protein
MSIQRLTAATLCVGAALTAWAAPGAAADTSPYTVGLTVAPATAAVGDQVTVVATVANDTSASTSATLGIENPQYAGQKIIAVSGKGCTPRNLQNLIYCGNPALGPGATATITVTLTPTTTGTDNFTAYGRITNNNDAYAYATLAVS